MTHMNDNLTASQADTLMQQLERQVPVNRSDSPRMAHIQPYVFQPETRSPAMGQTIPFERLHQTWLADVRTLVFDITRQKPPVTLVPLHDRAFGDWRATWQEPCQLHHLTLQPLGLTVVMVFEGGLISGLVDLIFGGDGSPSRRSRRKTLSHSEIQVAGKVTERLLQMLNAGWSDIMPAVFQRQRMETQPQFANFLPDAEVLCGHRFELQFGSVRCGVDILFPSTALAELQARLLPSTVSGSPSAQAGWEHRIRRQLEGAQVEMVAELASIPLTIAELLTLQRGDIIPISAPGNLQLRVGEKPVFECGMGISQGRHAVRIDHRLAGLDAWVEAAGPGEDASANRNQQGETA